MVDCSSGCFSRLRKKIKRLNISRRLVKAYVALFLAMFSSSYAITMLFPFAPFLVKFLLPDVKETDVGNYVGMLASAMFFGRFLSSYFWGVVADQRGRKPVIISSAVVLGLSVSVFGFSVHFAMAILTRFLVGAANGIVGTAKAVVSEISDDSTQSLGVSVISTSWGMGLIIGPAISGAISDPIGQYNLNVTNSVVRSFLNKFPYSLPCLLNTVLCLVSALAVLLLLPETKGSKKNRRRSEINQSELQAIASQHSQEGEELGSDGFHGDERGGAKEEDQRSLLGSCEDVNELEAEREGDGNHPGKRTVLHTYSVFISNIGANEKCHSSDHHHHGNDNLSVMERSCSTSEEKHCHIDETDIVENGGVSTAVDLPGDSRGSGREGGLERGEGATPAAAREEVKPGWRGKMKRGLKASLADLKLFLCSRGTSLSLFIYCIFSFAVIGMDEVYSLWAFTSPHHGGLGFTLYQIGISLSVAGALMLPSSLFLFPLLERCLGLINCYYLSVCVCIALSVLMPNLHYLVPVGLTWLLWVMLCTMKFLFMLFVSVGFASTILFINNSVTFDKLGALNGLAVSLTAIARTIAPIFAGSVFAASLSPSTLAIGFPFNYNLVFVLFGVVFLSTAFLAMCLPSSLNKQKIIEDANDNDDNNDDDPEITGEGAEPEVEGEGTSSLPSEDCEATTQTSI